MPGSIRLRLAGLLLGMGILVWLPFEDTRPVWSMGFAAGISALLAVSRLRGLHESGVRWLRRLAGAGALAGLATPFLAAALMLVKSGLHAHPSPDFTPQQFVEVLALAPAWFFGGLLLGSGAALWEEVFRRKVR